VRVDDKENMRLQLFIALITIGFAVATEVTVQGKTAPKNKPSAVDLNKQKGEVEANFGGLRGAKKSQLRQATESKLTGKNGEGRVETARNDKLQVERVKGPDGQPSDTVKGAVAGAGGKKSQINAQLGNGAGNANTAKQNPTGTWSRDNSKNTDAVLKAGRKDVHAIGNSRGEFNTEGSNGGKQKIVQQTSSKSKGSAQSLGTLELNQPRGRKGAKNNGDYKYDVNSDNRGGGKAGLSDAQQRPGRSGLKLDCSAPKVGEVGCANQVGKKTPTVVVERNGNARLAKDGTNIGRVNVANQGSRRDPRVVANVEGKPKPDGQKSEPVYLASSKGFKESDCYREITRKNDPNPNDIVWTKRSLKFVYNSKQNSDGSQNYAWPDCFKIEGEVTLGKDIDVKDLAIEFQARINPLGDATCADPATCGRGSCYYCDLCADKSAKTSILKNVDNNDVCDAKGGNRPRKVKISATFCPPPPEDKFPVCTTFSRPYSSGYWFKNDPTVVARVLIWERPKNTQALSDRFFYCLKGGSGCVIEIRDLKSDFRTQLKARYLASEFFVQKLDRGDSNPT
jgi:hypothetical protein